LPPLPEGIVQFALTLDDFNPNIVYTQTSPSRVTYKNTPKDVPDEHIFHADPKLIAYGNLLRLATQPSNLEIFSKVNAERPLPVFKSVQTVESRIVGAFS